MATSVLDFTNEELSSGDTTEFIDKMNSLMTKLEAYSSELNALGNQLPLSGGTMTGNLVMNADIQINGGNKLAMYSDIIMNSGVIQQTYWSNSNITTTPNMDTVQNQYMSNTSASHTINNPTLTDGSPRSGFFIFNSNVTAVSWGSYYLFNGGSAPSVGSGSGKPVFVYQVLSTTEIMMHYVGRCH